MDPEKAKITQPTGVSYSSRAKKNATEREEEPTVARKQEKSPLSSKDSSNEKKDVKKSRVITDSHYCAEALKEDLSIWEENGFEGAEGKQIAHQDLWTKIAELRQTIDLCVVNQKTHTKEGEHWQGNNEVDRYVQLRKIVFVNT